MVIGTHIALADGFDIQAAQFWTGVISLVVTIILALPAFWPRKKSKRLSFRVLSDAALIDEKKDLGEDDIQIRIDGNDVKDARLIMMQLMNTGSQAIKRDEYEYDNDPKIRFEFSPMQGEDPQVTTRPLPASKQRSQSVQPAQLPLVLCALHATKPESMMSKAQRKKQLTLGQLSETSSPHYDYVDLQGMLLNPGDYLNLKFLTQGKVDTVISGRLVGGAIVPYSPPPQLITPWRVVLIVVIAVLAIAFNLGIGSIQGFVQNNCAVAFSSVTDGGSTAFYNTAQSAASSYHAACFLGMVAVTSSSSGAGLRDLESGHLQIANSELSVKEAGYTYTDLQEHQVAVIVFTMIVNRHLTGITSLSREQITAIYNGTITNWQSVGGPDLPIKVIGRPSDSGTHAAFTRFVLTQPEKPVALVESGTKGVIDDVSADPGAIGYVDLGSADQATGAVTALEIDGNSAAIGLIEHDGYRFWAIERMYTRQDADVLSLAFVHYTTRTIQTNGTFIRIADMPKSVLAAHDG